MHSRQSGIAAQRHHAITHGRSAEYFAYHSFCRSVPAVTVGRQPQSPAARDVVAMEVLHGTIDRDLHSRRSTA